MPTADLRDAVLFLAPGFIALRIYHAFGFRRPRTDWHWAVWSVIASVPLDYASRWLLVHVQLFAIDPEIAQALTRLGVAVAAGSALAWLWWRVRFSKQRHIARIVKNLTDSVWDRKLEDADRSREQRPIEVETIDATTYFGWFEAAREDTGAEPWVWLERVKRRGPADVEESKIKGAIGMLIHRDQIRRVTIFESESETAKRVAAETTADGTVPYHTDGE